MEKNPDALSGERFLEFVSTEFEEDKDIIGARIREGIIEK
jgi:hypothetical protein